MPAPTITLHLASGTLYAVPNSGHVRALKGTGVTFSAAFPFRVEFTALTGGDALPNQDVCSGPPYQCTVTLPDVAKDAPAPAYKYTIKGDGDAAGRVLDPIIIVDKHY